MAVFLNVGHELLVFFGSPWTFLQPHLLTTWRPPHWTIRQVLLACTPILNSKHYSLTLKEMGVQMQREIRVWSGWTSNNANLYIDSRQPLHFFITKNRPNDLNLRFNFLARVWTGSSVTGRFHPVLPTPHKKVVVRTDLFPSFIYFCSFILTCKPRNIYTE